MAENSERSSQMFEPGKLVRDRYRVVRLIGKGGMGEVYEAQDTRRDQAVALKTVMPDLLESEKILVRFRREIELASRIQHPNVLRIYDVFDVDYESEEGPVEVPCMVTELLAGETLADRLGRLGALEPEEALPLACQMAEALDASHQAGVVHRDLKPDNVFLVPRETGIQAVLTDFGVARSSLSTSTSNQSSDSLTATNVILGTPNYLAPEQLELERATQTSDIYALGLVIYEMITGHLPFESDSPLQMVFKRVKEDPPSPRIYRSDLSPEWETTILRCLEREPEKRFPRAADIARSLGAPESETRAGAGADGRKLSLPRWWTHLLLMLAFLALIILVTLLL